MIAAPDILSAIAVTADKYGVPPSLLNGLIASESNYNPNAHNVDKNGTDYVGLGQFSGQTAAAYGVDRTDPISSIDGTARYLVDNYNKYGSWDKAIAQYKGFGTDFSPADLAKSKEYLQAGYNKMQALPGMSNEKPAAESYDSMLADAHLNGKKLVDGKQMEQPSWLKEAAQPAGNGQLKFFGLSVNILPAFFMLLAAVLITAGVFALSKDPIITGAISV